MFALHGGSIDHTFLLVSQLEMLLRGKIKVISKFSRMRANMEQSILFQT